MLKAKIRMKSLSIALIAPGLLALVSSFQQGQAQDVGGVIFTRNTGFASVSILTSPVQTVTLNPVADTSLFQAKSTANLGKAWLAAGTINQSPGKSRALVKFDVSSIPAGAVINSVDLSFRVVQAPIGPAASTFNLHRLLVPWTEGVKGSPALRNLGATATTGETSWDARVAPSTKWSSPGGAAGTDYQTAASASAPLSASATTLSFVSSAGLVDDVQSWVRDAASNQGWMLITQSENTARSARRFGSRETTGRAPSLVVTYTVAAPGVAPAITQAPQSRTVVAGSSVTFQVTASGTEPLTYQWSRSGLFLPSATASTLTLTGVQAADVGDYVVSISNAAGQISSSPVHLALVSAPQVSPLRLANGAAAFDFLPQALLSYTVEVAESLTPPVVWQTFQSVPASDSPKTVTVSDPAAASARFYRVRTP